MYDLGSYQLANVEFQPLGWLYAVSNYQLVSASELR
jgi:hypothetical protein